MEKIKYYFRNEDDEICYSIEHQIDVAKSEGLDTVTLFEAIPDKGNSAQVWCEYYASVFEKCDCTKKICPKYESNKGGRGACVNRGQIYYAGERLEFDVKSGEQINQRESA